MNEPEITLSNDDAIVELIRLRKMVLEEAIPAVKRKTSWRPSERAMAQLSYMRRATALRMAIDALKQEDANGKA